jgi:hypothetical protein
VAQKLDPKGIVTLEELLVSSMFEQEALVNLLERKGLIKKDVIPLSLVSASSLCGGFQS